jgi:Glycosyl hydrolases family 18
VKHLFHVCVGLLILLSSISAIAQEKTAPAFRAYKRPVMTWVPPYAVAKAKAMLTSDMGMGDALTHLGLQFWCPTKTGGIERAPFPEPTDQAVAELRDWGHHRGIRVLLCVYNAGTGKWDWPLARAAFADNRETFVKSLVAEVERLKLDGVDMDLEGTGEFPDADRVAFVAMMTDLSRELRARGKHLTVDTFAYEWHAPNQKWWPQLFPLVDGLTTMGYEQIGMTATPATDPWRAYAFQRDAAGEHKHKLMLGLPGGRDTWCGNTLAEQLDWIKKDGTTGVSFWDSQVRGKAWQTPQTWQTIKQISDGRE